MSLILTARAADRSLTRIGSLTTAFFGLAGEVWAAGLGRDLAGRSAAADPRRRRRPAGPAAPRCPAAATLEAGLGLRAASSSVSPARGLASLPFLAAVFLPFPATPAGLVRLAPGHQRLSHRAVVSRLGPRPERTNGLRRLDANDPGPLSLAGVGFPSMGPAGNDRCRLLRGFDHDRGSPAQATSATCWPGPARSGAGAGSTLPRPHVSAGDLTPILRSGASGTARRSRSTSFDYRDSDLGWISGGCSSTPGLHLLSLRLLTRTSLQVHLLRRLHGGDVLSLTEPLPNRGRQTRPRWRPCGS